MLKLEHIGYIKLMTRTERQEVGIQKWIKARCKGLLQWATGVGKTRAATMAIEKFLNKNPGRKVTVIVPSDYLKEQWTEILLLTGYFLNVEVKIINSAVKEEFSTDLLIIDEIHKMAAETFSQIFIKCKYGAVLGLTATLERLDGKHTIIEEYCPIVDTIETQEAINNGWLSPFKEYQILIDVDDIHIYEEWNRKFYEHFAFFNYDFNLAMDCLKDYKVRNALVGVLYKGNNASEKQIVSKMVHAHTFGFIKALKERKQFIYNHPKKIELVNFILEHRKDCKAVTFGKTIKMAEKIKYGKVLHSKQTKQKNRMTAEEFNLLKTGVLNTSKSINEGADIPGLNLAILYGIDSSKTTKTQQRGRVIRFEKDKESELFTIVIRNTVEEEWFRKSNQGVSFQTLDEHQLKALLTGEEVIFQKNKETSMTFRF